MCSSEKIDCGRMLRRSRGATLLEAVWTLATFLPILLAFALFSFDIGAACMFRDQLSAAAHTAANGLAVANMTNPSIAENRLLQESFVLNHIRVPGLISDSKQFETAFDAGAMPPTVTVSVTYRPGLDGVPASNPFRITSMAIRVESCRPLY